MTVAVKICGLKTNEAIDAAIAAGADYIGLVFFEPSPRNVSISEARALAEHIAGRARIVALLVNPEDMLIKRVMREVGPDILQLHGSETPERVSSIASLAGIPIMKAIKVETAQDAEHALDYNGRAEIILFDAKAPEDAVLPGGNGLAFDWHALESVTGRVDYMLSGGLTPDNVADAIRLTGASAVDVSSGVESAPGVKDSARIRAFIAAAKAL
ncbi:MAG TPA: phosphoribosylanthranilate isomerase [Hyphomicrobiaceae bacterium]|nr:phosphoribosylanthranilate isomerase [Hyphomicrobiaceae bacterium]